MEWICKNCGAYNDGPGQFCMTCGKAHPVAVQCVCPGCHCVRTAFAGMQCDQCGRRFEEDDFFVPGPVQEPVQEPVPEPGPEPGPDGDDTKQNVWDPPVPIQDQGPKKNNAVVNIAVTALIVVGALAALFIVLYFNSDEKGKDGGNEPAGANAAAEDQAEAPATAPPAAAATTSAPTTVPPTTAPPTTVPPTTVPPVTAPPTTQPPATAAPQTQPPAQYVPSSNVYSVSTETGDTLYLREGPGTFFPVITQMLYAHTVYYTGSQRNNFMSVDYTLNGRTYSGWASAKYLVPQGSLSLASYPLAYVSFDTDNNAGINLRSGPFSYSPRIRRLPEGNAVYRLDSTSGEYTLVQTIDGVRGWVMWKYLT